MQAIVSAHASTIFLLGILAAFSANMGLTTSHITLAQYGAYELQPKPSGIMRDALRNKPIHLILSGMMLAQVLVFLSVYIPPMYAIWVRPQIWTMCLGPYLVHYSIRMLSTSIPMNFEKLEERYDDEQIQLYLFLDGFLGQLLNPIVWPTPTFSRLLTAALFRYSHSRIFLGGVVVGWITGYASLIGFLCLFVYALQYAVPGTKGNLRYTMVFYNFFRPLGYVILLATGMMSYHLVYEDFHPVIEMDTMRRKDSWPNVFFETNCYRRPLWLPPAEVSDDPDIRMPKIQQEHLEVAVGYQLKGSKTNTEKAKPSETKKGETKKGETKKGETKKETVQTSDSPVDLVTGKKTKKPKPTAKKTVLAKSAPEPADPSQKNEYVFKPKEILIHQKRFGDIWFQECLDLGRRRLSHTFLPNLAFSHENLESLLNYPPLTLQDSKRTHSYWLQDLGQRRQRIYTSIGKRLRLIQKARKRFAALSEKRTVLVHPIPAPTSLDQLRMWIRAKMGLAIVDSTPSYQDIRLWPRVLGRSLPEVQDTESLSPVWVKTASDHTNQLQQWLLAKAQHSKISWVLPWAPLSPQHCQVLPIVLNNQALNYKPDALTGQQITWAKFIDQYEQPLLPKHLVVTNGPETLYNLGFWLHRLKMLSPIVEPLQQILAKRSGYLPNLPNAEDRMKLLIHLQKHVPLYTMSHVTLEGDPTYQMVNEQDLDAPSVGEGLWPIGHRANRFITTEFNQPRRNHGMIGTQWLRTPSLLPVSYAHCQALQLPDDDVSVLQQNFHPNLERKYTLQVYRDEADTERSPWEQILDKLQKAFVSSDEANRRAKRFVQFVSDLESNIHYVRNTLLLARMYLRQYVFFPTKITLKDIALRLIGMPSELEADWEEFQAERYIVCDFQGREPELATDVEDIEKKQEEEEKKAKQQQAQGFKEGVVSINEEISPDESKSTASNSTIENQKKKDEKPPKFLLQFPEKMWEEGIQIKIRSPFRLRPYRCDDEREMLESWTFEYLCRNLPGFEQSQITGVDDRARNLVQWLEAKATFLTLGGEIEAPGLPPPDILKRPFLTLYADAFLTVMQLRLQTWTAPVLRSPILKTLVNLANVCKTQVPVTLHKLREYTRVGIARVRHRAVQLINWLRNIYDTINRLQTWLKTVFFNSIVSSKKALRINLGLFPVPIPEPNAITPPSSVVSSADDLEPKLEQLPIKEALPVTISQKPTLRPTRPHSPPRTWNNIWLRAMVPPAYPRPAQVPRLLTKYLKLRGTTNDAIYRLALTRWRNTHRSTINLLRGCIQIPKMKERSVVLPRDLESAVWAIVDLNVFASSTFKDIVDRPWYHVVWARSFRLPDKVSPRKTEDAQPLYRLINENVLTDAAVVPAYQDLLFQSLQTSFRQRFGILAKRYLKLAITKELPLWLQFQIASLPNRTEFAIRELWHGTQLFYDALVKRYTNALTATREFDLTLEYGRHTVETHMLEIDRVEGILKREAEERRFTVKVLLRRLWADNLLTNSPEQDAHVQSTLHTFARTPRVYLELQNSLRGRQSGFTRTITRCLRWFDTRVVKLTRAERKLNYTELLRKLALHPVDAQALKLTRQDLREELRRMKTRVLLSGASRSRLRRHATKIQRHQWSHLLEGPAHCFVPTYMWSMWHLPTQRQLRRLYFNRRWLQNQRRAQLAGNVTLPKPLREEEDFMLTAVMNTSRRHQWRNCVQTYLDAARGAGLMGFARRYHGPLPPVQTYFAHRNTLLPEAGGPLTPLDHDLQKEKFFNFFMHNALYMEKNATDAVLEGSTLSLNQSADWHAGEFEAFEMLRKRLRRTFFMMNHPEDFPEYSPIAPEINRLNSWFYYLKGRRYDGQTSKLIQPQAHQETEMTPSNVSITSETSEPSETSETSQTADVTANANDTNPAALAKKRRQREKVMFLSNFHLTWSFVDWRILQLPESLLSYTLINPIYEFIATQTSLAPWLLCRKQRIAHLITNVHHVSTWTADDTLLLPETRREYRVLNLLRFPEDIYKRSRAKRARASERSTLPHYLGRFLWSPYRFEDLACMNRFWVGTANDGKLSFMRVRMYPLVKP